MKLKPTRLVKVKKEAEKKEVVTKKKKKNTLPPAEYKPMLPPKRLLLRETPKGDGTCVKQYLEISVKRFDDDEGLPFVWLSMYQESPKYTGYLKGKTVHLPLEMLYDVIDTMNEVSEECDEAGIEY